MYTIPYREWLPKKIQIADEIVDRHKAEGEPDAEILLCCLLGALAAMMWPGERIDRFRFIQFLVEFAPQSFDVQRIGLYHLIEKLAQDAATTQILIDNFFQSRMHYDGKMFLDGSPLPVTLMLEVINDASTIDPSETSVLTLLPDIPLKVLRPSSYAAIIYSDLRNSLIHQYRIKKPLASLCMSSRNDIPSYTNMSHLPDEAEVQKIAIEHGVPVNEARSSLTDNQRHLFFPYEYIRTLVVETAGAAFNYWDSASSWEKPLPNEADRWINGGKTS